MTYEIATPPLDRALDTSTRKEVLAYSEWFLAALPTRVEMLQKEVAATRGYTSWRADCGVESLERLGRWFESQVESTASPTEPSPSDAAVLELSVEDLEALESGLAVRTLSLCLDIGMYSGQVLVKNVPGAAWKQEFGGVSSADYGHVVVCVKGPLSCNPFRLMTVVAYRVASGARADLSGLYEISRSNIVSRNRRKPTRGSRRRR